MIIKEEIYNQLLKCPPVPPEIGGLLGGKDLIVNTVLFDKGLEKKTGIKYVPDINFLNECISRWYDEGINFYGIFHSHLQKWSTLSSDDEKYIEAIMNAMPKEIESLVFPLVFPGVAVVSYKAIKNKLNVCIIKDDINII